jgi:acetyl esterase
MKLKRYYFIAVLAAGVCILAMRSKNTFIHWLKKHQNNLLIWKFTVFNGAEAYDYTSGPGAPLKAVFFYPDKGRSGAPKPCIVYFFGGGYQNGGIDQFYVPAIRFSAKGYITVLVDYHVMDRHQTPPLQSMADASTLLKFLQVNARALNIDTSSVFACGASAGGQLALSTAFQNTQNPLRPKAIILYLPVVRTTPGGWGYQIMEKEEAVKMSPLEHLHAGFPPVLIFYGDKDETARPGNIFEFKRKAVALGIPVKLYCLKNTSHIFPKGNNLDRTLAETKVFLEAERKSKKEGTTHTR